MIRLDLSSDASGDAASQRKLRDAFGRFATGITVITALLPDGRRTGLTVNSFTSLSLDPAMILWNLRSGSPSEPAFAKGRAFAVNVLTTAQQEVSQRFCRPADDKFSGIAVEEGAMGAVMQTDHNWYVIAGAGAISFASAAIGLVARLPQREWSADERSAKLGDKP